MSDESKAVDEGRERQFDPATRQMRRVLRVCGLDPDQLYTRVVLDFRPGRLAMVYATKVMPAEAVLRVLELDGAAVVAGDGVEVSVFPAGTKDDEPVVVGR